VTRKFRTVLSMVIAISLYSPIVGASGGEAKLKKTSSPPGIHHLGKGGVARSKASPKDKAEGATHKKNPPQHKIANGPKAKPFVLPVEKSDVVPVARKIVTRSVVDQVDVKRAAVDGGNTPAEAQKVQLGEPATAKDVYPRLIRTEQVYIPQKPGCDAIMNYRRFRLTDADDWRRSACLLEPQNVGLETSE
jgi:hypothetical protein